MTKLAGVIEPLRPRLRTFRDEEGRELWDLPDAPLPEPDNPVPPVFLPAYDNALLGYADRRRVFPDGLTFAGFIKRLRLRSVLRGGLLIDGFLGGVWSITREDGTYLLTIEPFDELSTADADALTNLGARLLEFGTGMPGGRTRIAAPAT